MCLCAKLLLRSQDRIDTYAFIDSAWAPTLAGREAGQDTHVIADFLFVHVDQKDLHDVIGGSLKYALPQGLVPLTELPLFWITHRHRTSSEWSLTNRGILISTPRVIPPL